jgi:hypothetical protein
MSRSYKKVPVVKIAPKDGTDEKKFANRKVRRCKEVIADGKAYRKLFQSWDIHDYVCRYTYEDYRCHYEKQVKMYQTGALSYDPDRYAHSYCDWYKSYKRK